jgi:hypothetical protein
MQSYACMHFDIEISRNSCFASLIFYLASQNGLNALCVFDMYDCFEIVILFELIDRLCHGTRGCVPSYLLYLPRRYEYWMNVHYGNASPICTRMQACRCLLILMIGCEQEMLFTQLRVRNNLVSDYSSSELLTLRTPQLLSRDFRRSKKKKSPRDTFALGFIGTQSNWLSIANVTMHSSCNK